MANRHGRRAAPKQQGFGGRAVVAQRQAQPSIAENLLRTGRAEDALQLLKIDHKREPDNWGHISNIGIAYTLLGYHEIAVEWFEKALKVNPRHANSYSSLGASLEHMGKIDEAIAAFQKAIEIEPEHAAALANLSISLKERRRFDEAYDVCERALKLQPDNKTTHSNLIFTMEMDPRVTVERAQAARRRWHTMQRLDWSYTTWPNSPDPERKLRIGYLSSDFRRHSAAYSFAPLMFEYDKKRFDVTCLHSCPVRDDVTEWIAGAVDRLIDKVSLPDGQSPPIAAIDENTLVRIVRDLQIDILVDLSGHTSGHRLAVFTAKPAPIQCTSVGSMTGTGIPEMDWFMADPVIVPADVRHHFAEKIWDLPSAFTYASPDYAPDVKPAPCLERGYVTFGCLNRFSKTSPETIATWREILVQAPTSRLYLKDKMFGEAASRERLLEEMPGIDPARIEFAPSSPHGAHLDAHANVDVCLDPWPQSGGTSTLEALWMGCQVLTLVGERPSQRTGASIGAHVDDVWKAESVEDYIRIAVELCDKRDLLAERRLTLRARMRETPLADTGAWVRGVEDAYRAMWRQWCAAQQQARAA